MSIDCQLQGNAFLYCGRFKPWLDTMRHWCPRSSVVVGSSASDFHEITAELTDTTAGCQGAILMAQRAGELTAHRQILLALDTSGLR